MPDFLAFDLCKEIKKWKRTDNKVAGQAFLLLTEKNLIQNGLPRDPVKSITYLIETLKEYK
ncbi:hypothetical protein RhiirA1_479131 [Rhizophagus irregularis]|uniref:Uncharacterized protein n=1 Tax=Rhizophagus irregularis TaxID=588596 RepID=A0A2I1FRA8_9GLOM|nr:hypothetical protein RhiirA1_479131 [Rhizophagus irregularis]PKY36927.1 hypothetical protein RhiirB3_460744 [Rhizophagus irregularis]GET55633.1 hypothetical protein RIR_e72602_A0A2I1FRA8_9GLOM [Rhizophagus irregularis DAOM 181602=DAOM 197198]